MSFSTKEISELNDIYNKEISSIIQTISLVNNEVDVEGDDVDGIQGECIINIQEQLSRRDLIKLDNIKKSLEKIKDNTFGLCENCEELIGFKRMKIIPGVKLCIVCAEIAEKVANV